MRKGHGKNQTRKIARTLVSVPLAVAGLSITFGLLSPNTHAADCSSSGSGSASCDMIVNLVVPGSISITGSPSVYFNGGNDLTPGIFYNSAATVSVTTNSGHGYTLSMQMSENQPPNSTNTLYYNSSEYIPSITKVQKQADFEKDPTTGGWGFALDATNYRPLPTVTGSTYDTLNLKRTFTVANNDTTTLTFGVLPPSGIKNAIYQNIVTVTATANDAITLTRLDITGTPTKTHYSPGSYFNTDGLTIYAIYSDGKQVLLTDGQYVVNNGNPLVAGQDSVSIAYTANGSTVTSAVSGITVDNNTVNGDPVDNSTTGNNGASTGSLSTSTRGSSADSGSNDSNNGGSASSNNVDPQGVTDSYGSPSSSSDSDNALLAVMLGASAAVATSGIILLAAKRKREKDEEDSDIGLGEV